MSRTGTRTDPSRDRFLRAATGNETERPPVWMMRQAGRYLPEYREIRQDYSFTEAISTPEIAIEISLQPWERFEPDGVVMYSDILPALELLGFSYHLESGVGPVVENPITDPSDVDDRPRHEPEQILPYVGTVLSGLTDTLGDRAATIGFVGGPFTLAAYALEGTPARNFMAVRRFRHEHPEQFVTFLSQLGDALVDFAVYQQEAGADVIQVFDTYAGLLPPRDLHEFVVPIQQRIIDSIDVPTIMFARNMGQELNLLAASGADVIGLDWTVEMANARHQLGDRSVQGNLDPAILFGSPARIREQTREIVEAAGSVGHILNLGHGVHKSTPVEGVAAFFDAAKTVQR